MEQQTEQQAIQYFEVAAQMTSEGKSETEIKDSLVQMGLSEDHAWAVIGTLGEEIRKQKKAQANKNMLYGALWCFGGLIATAVTDGQVLFYGAIIVGGIQLITGIVQSVSNS